MILAQKSTLHLIKILDITANLKEIQKTEKHIKQHQRLQPVKSRINGPISSETTTEKKKEEEEEEEEEEMRKRAIKCKSWTLTLS
jgi:CO dehydrogenase/acetyl-CoA synthase beta subunit